MSAAPPRPRLPRAPPRADGARAAWERLLTAHPSAPMRPIRPARVPPPLRSAREQGCLLYTSDAADDM
eukprot:3095502-Prymnesium_polylepis.1